MIAVGLNGSPVIGGSCEILLKKVLGGAASTGCDTVYFDINKAGITPCLACGKSPYPDNCFFDDGIENLYRYIIDSDIIIFASPVYFDTVSAQTKLLIDRCNCLKPAIFPKGGEPEPTKVNFLDRRFKKRKGVIILSGGQRQKFNCARTVIKGFFKWVNIDFAGEIEIRSGSLKKGLASERDDLLETAFKMGEKLACQVSNASGNARG